MKFEFNWANWFVRKLCFNILMGLQYERPKLKGQRSTFQVRIMTKTSTVLKKINFSEIFPFNALGSKFDLDVKKV